MSPLRFRFSKPDDEPAIRAIHSESKMNLGAVEAGIQFYGPVKVAMEQDRIAPVDLIVFENSGGKIEGTASLTQWSSSHLARVGITSTPHKNACYLGDLRIAKNANREVRKIWRSQYSQFVSDLSLGQYFGKPFSIVTSILDANRIARSTLEKTGQGFYYHPLHSYSTFTILRILPQTGRTEGMLEVRKDLKRYWEVTENGQTNSLRTAVVSRAEPFFNETLLRNSLASAWRQLNLDEPFVLQMGVHAHWIPFVRNALCDWETLETPATLYEVTPAGVPQQLSAKTAQDITIDITSL